MHSNHPVWGVPPNALAFPPLDADLRVDVAIVGGGITGLTTALLLADAGKRVALLEGRKLGSGVTGRTTAHLTEAVDIRYHRLVSKFGLEGARAVRSSSRDAIELIAKLSQYAAPDCGFERLNGYLFTETRDKLDELEAELQAAAHCGASVERAMAPLPFGVAGGICFADQAQLNPAPYLSGLIERLASGRVRIFEGVSMLDVEGVGPLRVVTDRGHGVVADHVVLATHAPFAKLTLQLKLAQYRS